jgi:hypothetical protein
MISTPLQRVLAGFVCNYAGLLGLSRQPIYDLHVAPEASVISNIATTRVKSPGMFSNPLGRTMGSPILGS